MTQMNSPSTNHRQFGTRSPYRPRRPVRRGVMISIEMLFFLPLLIFCGLVIVQFVMISSADQRVQAATLAAAELASLGAPADKIHEEARNVLGYLGYECQTEIEYIDIGGDPEELDECEDVVVVAVRIPMGLASKDYIGLFGASVNKLHIRCVVKRTLRGDDHCDCDDDDHDGDDHHEHDHDD